MPPQTNTEEIIEKKATAPVATSCLIIAAVALLCAIALQLTEIAEYRSGLASTNPNPGLEQAKKDANKYKEEVGDILSKAPKIEGDGAETKAGAAPAEAPTDEDAGADAKADETDTTAGDADTKADESTEEADAKADAKEDAPATEEEAGTEEEAADEKAGE
jgi:hypothetical protein